MARVVRQHVEGLREVDRALGELPKATGKNVLRRVGIARLEPMAERMQQLAPELSGTTKDSVAVSTRKPRRHRKESTVEVFAGPGRMPQAHLREFGGDNRPPEPFVRPAWDEGKDELLEGIGEDLWAEIEKAAARLAKKAARTKAKGG